MKDCCKSNKNKKMYKKKDKKIFSLPRNILKKDV